MRTVLNNRLVRFLLVGALNTGISYSIYAALLFVGLPYVVANFGALVLGIFVSFRTQGRLVFGNQNDWLIFRFAAFWGLIFLFNISLIALLMRGGLNAYWAGAIAIVPVTLASYQVQKVLVFGTPRPGDANR